MTVNVPAETSFLYVFETGSSTHRMVDGSVDVPYQGETYTNRRVRHQSPRFSAEPEDGEIDITLHDTNPVTDLFLSGPPAYPIIANIYEYDRIANVANPYYRGWVVRSSLKLVDALISLRCKTVWHFFDRDSLVDSLSSLSRYSVFDPRSGVDLTTFRVNVIVTAFNDERDVLTVTGITDIDGWFDGGVIVAPDQDKRTILKHETVGPDKQLTLSAAFPRFTLDVGFPAELYPGDDLTYDTWANKFGAETNNGEAWGGWQYMPNVDPAIKGVI